MNDILLSIVIPTKNREEYLKSFIDLYSSFDKNKTELVIQDNSDTENSIENYIKKYPDMHIVYNYIKESMPVIQNSELAIMHSNGKYVCFMGDDDLLSMHIVGIVEKMDEAGVDSIIFNKATYNWPGMEFKAHNFPNLIIPKFTGKYYYIDPNTEYQELLHHGATELGKIPQLYHGVIKRTVLDDIKRVTGTFFPGPSPDMAIATCLSCFVSNHIFFDAPFVSSGKSPKSAAGLGAKHEHKGDLKSMTFLPLDIEKKWDKRLPFIWTGPTIYAESAIEAICAMGKEEDLEKFNYSHFYACFDTFCQEYKELANQSKRNLRINRVEYLKGRIKVFIKRVRIFIKNKLLLGFHIGGTLVNNVPNCVQAESIIDNEIEKKITMENISFFSKE